ncbi:MAG: GntR family transcriptional regulator [Peptoniphilus sp.]|uniref:GntR family transcriptional regulator n=1 Tax=Peptoniphilus sp. TaxID=1971214 RepID=UPI002A75F5CD|nr:GntR family transcriptional regulator [Peptoniphilus sp.]MDY2987816.1 GntR family transcriptional regulator [Peptoniphilus sp.]
MITLAENLYLDLRKRVVAGEWDVGQRINEKELAESLHVSRTPLRKALQEICKEGLLDYTKNFGYHIKLISIDDVNEIYKIRISLEKLAFKEAAKNLTKKSIDDINKILEYSEFAASKKDSESLIRYSNEYNEEIYKLAKMPRLRIIQTGLQNYLSRFRQISFSGDERDRSRLAVEEHRLILEAMIEKDEAKLNAIIEQHLNRSYEYIIEIVNYENNKAKEMKIEDN